jgi:hypothetical protein
LRQRNKSCTYAIIPNHFICQQRRFLVFSFFRRRPSFWKKTASEAASISMRNYLNIEYLELDISEWTETFKGIIYIHYWMVGIRSIVLKYFFAVQYWLSNERTVRTVLTNVRWDVLTYDISRQTYQNDLILLIQRFICNIRWLTRVF